MLRSIQTLVFISSWHLSSSQPAVDECVSVNATTPAECPDHIGPPCPPCFTNDRPDYTSGASLSLQDKTIQALLSKRIDYWINFWLDNYPPNKTSPLDAKLSTASSPNTARSFTMIDGDILARNDASSSSSSSLTGTSTQFNIFTGSAGRGQLFLRLYRYTNNDTYLSIANQYINHALSLLPRTQSNPSYLEGHIGVYTIKLLYESILKKVNQTKIDIYETKILDVFNAVDEWINDFYDININNGSFDNAASNSKLPNIVYNMYDGGNDLGLAGLIYTGLFVNNYFNKEIVDSGYFMNLTNYLIDLGVYEGRRLYANRAINGTALYGFDKSIEDIPLMYECPFLKGCYMYGMGHGNGGVLKWIFESIINYFPEMIENGGSSTRNGNGVVHYLTNTLNYLTEIQLADGNMPTAVYGNCSNNYGTDDDARVQWCHGAPGYIDVFSEATYLYQKYIKNDSLAERYFNASLAAADSVWTRGLLVKGSMIGHGITGNSYMMALLNKNVQNIENLPSYSSKEILTIGKQHQYRSNQFIEWTLDEINMNATRCIYSDADESMFAGCPGIVNIYIQAMDSNWPDTDMICVPTWNYCI